MILSQTQKEHHCFSDIRELRYHDSNTNDVDENTDKEQQFLAEVNDVIEEKRPENTKKTLCTTQMFGNDI